MSTTTSPRYTRLTSMVVEMINSGELSVGEARQELAGGVAGCWLAGDAAEQILAQFILDHGDDDDFRATRSYCHSCGAPARGQTDEGQPCVECGAPGSEVRD